MVRFPHGVLWWFVALVLMTAGAGCSTVTTQRPLPHVESAAELSDREQLEGSWACRGAVVQLRFRDDGTGVFAAIDWEGDTFVLEQHELMVVTADHRHYFSVRVFEDGAWHETYYLVEYRITDDGDLVVWEPIVKAFSDAVESGRLEGSVRRGEYSNDVVLSGDPQAILAFLTQQDPEELFDLADPVICHRVAE